MVSNARFYSCFHPDNPDISRHIWASGFYFATRENLCKPIDLELDGSEEALDITGKDVSEEHVGTESRLLNAYGSLVVVRGQNENRTAAKT